MTERDLAHQLELIERRQSDMASRLAQMETRQTEMHRALFQPPAGDPTGPPVYKRLLNATIAVERSNLVTKGAIRVVMTLGGLVGAVGAIWATIRMGVGR